MLLKDMQKNSVTQLQKYKKRQADPVLILQKTYTGVFLRREKQQNKEVLSLKLAADQPEKCRMRYKIQTVQYNMRNKYEGV